MGRAGEHPGPRLWGLSGGQTRLQEGLWELGHIGRASGLLGALADLMLASVSLSVNWAQGDLRNFLMTILDPKAAPQAPLSLFPFRDLNSSHEGVSLKREARARNLAWDSTSKRWGRPGQASTSLCVPSGDHLWPTWPAVGLVTLPCQGQCTDRVPEKGRGM